MRLLHIQLLTTLLILLFLPQVMHASDNNQKIPLQYTVVLDLSDRVLIHNQIEKDITLIETAFKRFEKKARLPFILTSKDRFSVKIIPQNGSPLDINYFENKLQLNLNEVSIKEKNEKLVQFSASLRGTLETLYKSCKYGKKSSDYAGVDIWRYLNNTGLYLDKKGYDTTVLILTDGYFDFESRTHVLRAKNKFTSTQFLKELKGFDWMITAKEKDYGLIPITLGKNVNWIVSSITSKHHNDILQTKKITFIWEKWLKESGVTDFHFILNSTTRQMNSQLLELL